MLGIIGVGACGGNIADEGCRVGIPSVAINYSKSDLNSLENLSEDKRLHLTGSEGVGKDRSEALRLVNNNWEDILFFINNEFMTSVVEVIFVVFSTGGGSGGGMSPVLLDILINEFPEKTFVAVPVIPSVDEVLVNQLNFIKTSEELSNLNLCILPIDNESASKFILKPNKNNVYDFINNYFINMLVELIDFTKKSSKYGVLDMKDLHTLFKTKGVMNISHINIADLVNNSINLSVDGLTKMIRSSWNESIFAKIELDTVVRSGFIYNGQEGLLKLIDIDNIFKIFDNTPIDLFEGYYFEGNGDIYMILAGLSFYRSRLKTSEDLVKENYLKKSELLSRSDNYEFEMNEFSKVAYIEKEKKSVLDILKKYDR